MITDKNMITDINKNDHNNSCIVSYNSSNNYDNINQQQISIT